MRCLLGALAGVAFTAALLLATRQVLSWATSPMQSMEHWTIYLSMVLGAGFGALWTPRGHIQSLLGGPGCAEISQRLSSIALASMAIAFAGLAIALTRPNAS